MPPRRPSSNGPGAALALLVLLGGCVLGACDDESPAVDGGGDATMGGLDAFATDSAAETADAGSVDAELEAPPAPYPRPQYQRLSETGLYSDFAARRPSAGVREFRPVHQLWSDAAEKQRWIYLPAGTRIDTSEMDAWQLPVGTKLWKEFARTGPAGKLALETRLIERHGPGPEDYWMGAFVWAADGSDALFVEHGASDINGTTHDAPPAKNCLNCHRGEPGRILGLTAVQSSHLESAPGLTLSRLIAEGLLTHPPGDSDSDYRVPGDDVTAAALGYLHANCGHCHNRNGAAWPDTQAIMRLGFQERTAESTGLYRTLVGQRFTYWRHPTLKLRVSPGDVEASAVVARMKLRGSKDQMPPLATEVIDPVGIEAVSRWITSLPPAPTDGGVPSDAEVGVDTPDAAPP